MPLKKEYCKNCHNNYGEFFNDEDECVKQDWIWDENNDERDWKDGYVYCPVEYTTMEERYRKITRKPPENCPYYLENII